MKPIFTLLMGLVCLGCAPNNPKTSPIKSNWIDLFNGSDLAGWEAKFAGRPPGENYRNTFRVEDSMLRISYDDYENFDDAYGHLYYEQPYSHYRLRFEYRFVGDQSPGGEAWNVRNSGVMLHSQSARSNDANQNFPVSIELQLLGGLGDGPRPTGNVCTPGTAVVLGDTVDYRHCIESRSATYDGNKWVRAEAIVMGSDEMHFLIEGDTVLSFTEPQIGGGFIYRSEDHADWQAAGISTPTQVAWTERKGELLEAGYIALQAESHPIDFRNIQLRVLPEQ